MGNTLSTEVKDVESQLLGFMPPAFEKAAPLFGREMVAIVSWKPRGEKGRGNIVVMERCSPSNRGHVSDLFDVHQQKGGLPEIQWCCVLTLRAWTLRPVRPVRPVPVRHIWLRLVPPETLAYTGLRSDTCNQVVLPPMHPDLKLNTIAHQASPLPLILLSVFFVF